MLAVRNGWEHRANLGGWWIQDADGNRLALGVGRQIDPGAELRVHTACSDDTDEAVFACLDEPVLHDDGDVLTLRQRRHSSQAISARHRCAVIPAACRPIGPAVPAHVHSWRRRLVHSLADRRIAGSGVG